MLIEQIQKTKSSFQDEKYISKIYINIYIFFCFFKNFTKHIGYIVNKIAI